MLAVLFPILSKPWQKQSAGVSLPGLKPVHFKHWWWAGVGLCGLPAQLLCQWLGPLANRVA